MSWFIVVGRRWGDDEATALKVQAADKDVARKLYRTLMADEWTDGPQPGFAPGDGPGTVWVDQIFECGEVEPREVS